MSRASEEELDEIYAILEEGDLEQALIEAEALAARYPSDPDSLLALAASQFENEHFQDALDSVKQARAIGDEEPTLALGIEGSVFYEQGRFQDAKACFEKILEEDPERVEAWIDLSYTAEHLGDRALSDKAYAQAHRLDPENFPDPLRLTQEAFDVHLQSAIEGLPEEFQNLLEEVPVVVQPLPSPEMLGEDGISPDTLGLFVGQNLQERSTFDASDGTEMLFLFQRNIERISADEEDLRDQIHVTLYHELGHLLGWEEEDMEEHGLN